jgi:hypothetical protein
VHSEECAISLSLKMCRSNQSPLAISIQVWNSVRPMHLFGHNFCAGIRQLDETAVYQRPWNPEVLRHRQKISLQTERIGNHSYWQFAFMSFSTATAPLFKLSGSVP